ncbi:hypothetical protein QO011_004178 [Labrys wisconsinensis]|uniref:Uncharacterized protein n=1 Tax=Labrys wisconsinensis TaxID=425677 RepID=A0ABU0JA62_9HYPH|nr:hypothetical protein [Labrys wisconsinensis]
MAERQPETADLEADIDAAIAACGGDPRATIRALLIAQAYYEADIAKLTEAVSRGYMRRGSEELMMLGKRG